MSEQRGAGEELIHTCAAGHEWRVQADRRGVSPSWGLAGSRFYLDRDPHICPEPEFVLPDPGTDNYRYEIEVLGGWKRAIRCPGCGAQDLPWNMFAGISSTPWAIYENPCPATFNGEHLPPVPVCGLPPEWGKTVAWRKTTLIGADGKPYKGHNWIPLDPDVAMNEAEPGTQGGLF